MVGTQESMTAKICSFARAYHSNYSRIKIFDDFLAYDLMGKKEYEEIGEFIENDFNTNCFDKKSGFQSTHIRSALIRYILPIPLSRAAFAENEFSSFASRYDTCQYIICGAGMDTFAFRNENPGIRVFEVDHPDTQRYKLEKIKKLEWIIPKNVRYVPVDFSKGDIVFALRTAGFSSKLPSFFTILGVTYYLTFPVFEDTIRKISYLSGAGDEIVFDFPDETTFSAKSAPRVRRLSEITSKLGEKMLHGYSAKEIQSVLKRQSFQIAVHKTPDKIQSDYFKNRTDGQCAFENIHFIAAKRE